MKIMLAMDTYGMAALGALILIAIVIILRKNLKKAAFKIPFFSASLETYANTQAPTTSLTPKTKNVLFIDDDTTFPVIEIIRKDARVKCDIVKDIESFQDPLLVAADIIFVDIEGVGNSLTPADEGLGLVVAIHDRYPKKKIIIYSSKTKRDAAHKAFRIATDVLLKEAPPSEFLWHIERLFEA